MHVPRCRHRGYGCEAGYELAGSVILNVSFYSAKGSMYSGDQEAKTTHMVLDVGRASTVHVRAARSSKGNRARLLPSLRAPCGVKSCPRLGRKGAVLPVGACLKRLFLVVDIRIGARSME